MVGEVPDLPWLQAVPGQRVTSVDSRHRRLAEPHTALLCVLRFVMSVPEVLALSLLLFLGCYLHLPILSAFFIVNQSSVILS